jgi:Glycosyltransferase family 87
VPITAQVSKPRLPIISICAALLAIVAAVSIAQRLHGVRHRYNEVDFVRDYGWWTIYSSGGDPWIVTANKTELRPGLERPRFCNYTPVFVEVFSPLARLDQKTAFWLWLSAQILCVGGAVLMLARGNDPPLSSAATVIVLSLVVLSRPFEGMLAYAHVTPMLLALLSASWFCARRERPRVAGLCLALAALLKLYPAAAGGYFLFGRRWRALGWTIGFFVAGVLLTNPARWIELMTVEMPVSYRFVAEADLTVMTFVRKAVALFTGTTTIAAPLFTVLAITALIDLVLLAIAAMATITSRGRDDLDGLVFGMWLALALLMSPLAWMAEMLLLLPAYLFGTLAAWQGFQRRDASRRHVMLNAGAVILTACIVTALIKAVPHPGFWAVLGAYISAALIVRARLQSDLPRDKPGKIADQGLRQGDGNSPVSIQRT